MNEKYFETIKCDDYEIFNLSYHERRVAKTIGMNLNLQEYIYPPTNELFRCKLIYSINGIEDVQYHKYEKRKIQSFKLVYSDNIEYSKKYLDRSSLDKLFDQKGEADEIIIVKNGFITDTSIGNIAIYDGNNWFTPKHNLLNGTTRDRMLEEKIIYEKDISVKNLEKAEKLAIMNAMIDFDIIKNYKLDLNSKAIINK